MVAGKKGASLLAVATSVSASVLELPVTVFNGYATVDFQVGTPSSAYRLQFDTGSSSSWILDTRCTEESCPDGGQFDRTPYNSSASSTAVDKHTYAGIGYVDGDSVTGQVFQDVWSTANSELKWNSTFLSVNESAWRNTPADGMFGMGFSSIAENNTVPVVEQLLWDGQLDAPRMGLYYGINITNGAKQDGVLTIGGSHEDEYVDGEMLYFPLRKENPYQLWRGALRSVNIMAQSNTTLQLHTGSLPTIDNPEIVYPEANETWSMYGGGTAVFDTGASAISIPDNIIDAVYYNLGWNNTKLISHEEVMECKHLNASWGISFTLGEGDEKDDVTFTVRGDEIYQPGGQCMPPFNPSGGGDFALLGNQFLRRWYTVFDFGADKEDEYKPRIGLGRLKKEKDFMRQ